MGFLLFGFCFAFFFFFHLIWFGFSFCLSPIVLLYFQVLLTSMEIILGNYLAPGLLSFWWKDVLLSVSFTWTRLLIATDSHILAALTFSSLAHCDPPRKKSPTLLWGCRVPLMHRFRHRLRTPFCVLGSSEILVRKGLLELFQVTAKFSETEEERKKSMSRSD